MGNVTLPNPTHPQPHPKMCLQHKILKHDNTSKQQLAKLCTSGLQFVVFTDLLQDFLVLSQLGDLDVDAGTESGSQVGGTEGKVTMAIAVRELQVLF